MTRATIVEHVEAVRLLAAIEKQLFDREPLSLDICYRVIYNVRHHSVEKHCGQRQYQAKGGREYACRQFRVP